MRRDLEHISSGPLRLLFTRARRTYFGGALLEKLHGFAEPHDSFFPEEWVGSTVPAYGFGVKDEGLSGVRLEGDDCVLLRDLIHLAPERFLGPRHVEKYGENPALLVKLIDSAERLSIQVHPDRQFAQSAFGSKFGKTEAWYILGTRKISGKDPYLLIGFKPWVTRNLWEELIRRQDTPAMIDCMHRVSPAPGEVYMIEGGLPHAIGCGCFLVEIQEPTDYTLRAEMSSPQGDPLPEQLIHQGIGFERLPDCFHYDTGTYEETIARYRVSSTIIDRQPGGVGQALTAPCAAELFTMVRMSVAGEFTCAVRDNYSLLVLVAGNGMLYWPGGSLPLDASSRLFLPYGMRGFTLVNTGGQNEPLEVVQCSPPGALIDL